MDNDIEINLEEDMNDDIEDRKCPECDRTSGYYCKPCGSSHFRDKFSHWTSGDSNIDELIRNTQLNAEISQKIIEWIEYSNLENIEFVVRGGFGNVYKAIWKDGPIDNSRQTWDIQKSDWRRENWKEVAVKKFRNVTSMNPEFLNEIKINLELYQTLLPINRIYGVTLDPQNGEYAIVTEFKNKGNLRELIKKDHNSLSWNNIVRMLRDICIGLFYIHKKNYHHKDLHSGNILNSINLGYIKPAISDFGLCRPADKSSADKVPYGVLPFIAPEVLRGEEFTTAADIYGFGMLMSEIISGEVPFIDREYDLHLALNICKGERPQIPEYAPEPYVALMKRCWDLVPSNRPTAIELYEQLYNNNNDNSAYSQEREARWKERLAKLETSPQPLKKSQNLLTSKRLDYSKHLSQLLESKDVEIEMSEDDILF